MTGKLNGMGCAARKLMWAQPNSDEERQTCTHNVSLFSYQPSPSIDPIDPVDLGALLLCEMPPPSTVDATSNMQVQEKAIRRSRKQARKNIVTNALINAAGTGECPKAIVNVTLTLTISLL